MLSLFNAVTLLLGILFIAYVIGILIPYLRHKPEDPGDPTAYSWHFFIPCRDEATVIAATITRARNDFPFAHVWVVDDDSDDDTARIAEQFATSDSYVHLVRRKRPKARTGKGDALNSAYAELNAWLPSQIARETVIVAVIDADGEMEPGALDVVASESIFGDAATGAAQITVWMKNRSDRQPFPKRGRVSNRFAAYLLRMQDIEFRTVIAAMQSLRARTGTVGLGGNGQFTRLTVLDAIGAEYGKPWHGALLEDYELGVHVLLAGYQVRHVYGTHVSQEALPSLRRLLTQRTRWAQGNIQCVKYIKAIVKSEHFDSAGVIETSYYLVLPFLQMLGAIAFATLFTAQLTHGVDLQLGNLFSDHQMFAILALVSLFSIAPFAVWGFVYKYKCETDASWATALLWGLGMWLYVYYMYICIARAFGRLCLGRNGWSKTRRNAEEHTVIRGSVAIEK